MQTSGAAATDRIGLSLLKGVGSLDCHNNWLDNIRFCFGSWLRFVRYPLMADSPVSIWLVCL